MNKHQKLALLIAPFLLIGGYIAADYYSIAKEKTAMEQKAGRLKAVDGCNLQADACTLQKGPLEIKLRVNPSLAEQLLLVSNHSLDGVTIAFGGASPEVMSMGSDNKHWNISLSSDAIEPAKIKLITSINEVFYFADVIVDR